MNERKTNSVLPSVSSLDLYDDGYPDFISAQAAGNLYSYINVLADSSGGNNFVKVTVEGTVSNRSAIGAVVRLIEGRKVIGMSRVDGGSGYAGISSKTLIFGLPSNTLNLRIEVFFPASRVTREITVKPGDRITIRETEGVQLIYDRSHKIAEQFFVSGAAANLLLQIILTESTGFIIFFIFLRRGRISLRQFKRGLSVKMKLFLSCLPGIQYLFFLIFISLILYIFPDNQGWTDGRDRKAHISILSFTMSSLGVFFYLKHYHVYAREMENFESGVKKLEMQLSQFRHGESSMMNLNRISLYLNNIPEGEILDR